ncbi:MAG: lysophospholipid acyltransferase family protein [Deltaproteobacteria bacterium]|nr:lysophospholipid acyltransferase family protein [Deltaproteobacteria bacterium]
MRQGARKGLLYRARYRGGEYLLRAFVGSLRWLPGWATPYVAGMAERVSRVLLWRYRKRMRDTLAQTMAEELPTEAERRTVVHRAWRNFAQSFLEAFATLHMTGEEICSRIEINGEEHLRAALARNKGVLALSAHFGNFPMIGPRLAAQGYDFSVVLKLAQEERFAALQHEYVTRTGAKVIPARPRRESVPRIIQALRRNGIVLVLPDEFRTAGVEVDFLGHRAPAPKGPVTIAQRTGAAVVPLFMVRGRDNRLTLHVKPEIRFVNTGDREADLRTNARLFVQAIEDMVRRHPDQWSWMGFRKPAKGDASHALP